MVEERDKAFNSKELEKINLNKTKKKKCLNK